MSDDNDVYYLLIVVNRVENPVVSHTNSPEVLCAL